ncbi:hypothetical protein NLU13_5556 [Sarocladium strictum]|uniref:ORP1 like protein n=1 Tax=Sarocladium strictum TaxID=5046 RepID=A0AA39L7R4_SARSR|nr:hypothetical protein NLU13_5556 [Sarocladium strictum]
MATMEILTLLNTAATNSGKSTSREASPSSSSHEDLATPPSTTVPTPSPEPSWTRPQVADKNNGDAQPWDTEEASLNAHTDSGFGWNANFSFPFKGESIDYALEMNASGSGPSGGSTGRPHRIVADSSSYTPQDPSSAEDAFVPPSADSFRLPDYRRHKYSDSHSSLASFATSRSDAHSRISSVTTINEIPSIDAVLSEVSRADASSPGLLESSPTQAEKRHKSKSQDASLSPRGRSRAGFIVPRITRAASPSDVALNMKQSAGVKPPSSATMSSHPPQRNTGRVAAPRTHKRAVSAPVFPPLPRRLPPFTINQSRPLLPPPHQMMTGSVGSSHSSEETLFHRHGPPNVVREHEQTRPGMFTRHSDSETTNTPSASASHLTSPTNVSQASMATQSKSQPDDVWDIDDENLRMPSFEELELHGMQDETVQCIFVDKCATNSPIRKSVSHFFGRNKGTTLQIPEHIWLVYCRQHYQRLRYRLGQKYALHQLDLVKVVIHRIERWGKDNKAKNDGAEVLDWQIMLRKCVRDEQERWTRYKQDLRRQALSQPEQDERYESFKMSRVGHSKYTQGMSQGNDVGLTQGLVEGSTNSAAETLMSIEKNYPWLLDTLGDHRSEEEVIAVIDHLRQDYKAALEAKTSNGVSIIKELPPIEFLPNLTNDNEDRPIKTGRKRGPARTARASESFKRRATRTADSPDAVLAAGVYPHASFDTASSLPHLGGSTPYDHPQMGHWIDRRGQDRGASRPSFIVPQIQPLNYGYRPSPGSSVTPLAREMMPLATPLPGQERAEQSRNLLPVPRPTHHRSASAFTPITRYSSTLERPSSSGEGAAIGRSNEQGDYFSSFATAGPPRNTHIFGDLGGYQMTPYSRASGFDFTPRSRPGAWADPGAPELPHVHAWAPYESSSASSGTFRGEDGNHESEGKH